MNIKEGDKVTIFGASGNTGMFAVQIAKALGADVYAISRKKWVTELGAKEWNGEKSNIVVNSIGAKFWNQAMDALDVGGKIVTFGTATGPEVSINLANIYSREFTIIGSTGGTKKELIEFIEFVQKHNIKSKIWKIYKIEDFKKAIAEYPEKEGRIVLQL